MFEGIDNEEGGRVIRSGGYMDFAFMRSKGFLLLPEFFFYGCIMSEGAEKGRFWNLGGGIILVVNGDGRDDGFSRPVCASLWTMGF